MLGQLLRTLNPEELKRVSGDVFGRIYEYFLTQFADQKAHDGGEFFTPVSLVSLIANVIEPAGGTVLDPACGSGGMFVQSARVVERRHENPTEKLTFYGLEKNATTIRLAKMNLAVHGLEGDIQKVITYYEDPHELLRKADFVMANPPFNVDEIDADKVKSDPRLPFGLPGVNKKGKVSNGNYVWISYFYSYLNEQGRAGFVMSSQASSAGRDEAKVRQKLVETGDVDVMVAIRSNFFYTRTVPCELWFLNRAKPEQHRDKVLMIDARNIYRKVTRKIFDFSPEQEQNLLAIVWLYRGETGRYLDLVAGYCQRMLAEGAACFTMKDDDGKRSSRCRISSVRWPRCAAAVEPFLKTLAKDAPHAEGDCKELDDAIPLFKADVEAFRKTVSEQQAAWGEQKTTNGELKKAVDRLATAGRDQPRSGQADRPALQARLPPDRNLRKRVQRPRQRRLGRPRHHPRPQGRRRGPRPGRGTAQAGALLLETGPLAHRTLPRGRTSRCRRAGQAGGPGRDRGQRLEPHPRSLCRRRAGGRGRGF